MQKSKGELTIQESGGNWGLYAGGKPVRTPKGHALIVPNMKIAEIILAEIDAAHGVKPVPPMPYRQLANTALDLTVADRGAVEGRIANYAMTELLCYRAVHPQELVMEQNAAWQPWLDWCAATYGIVLPSVSGILPYAPPQESLIRLHDILSALSLFELTVLQHAVDVLGSVVLGLAVYAQVLSPGDAVRIAEIDQSYQARQWGEDREHKERQRTMLDELLVCTTWFSLVSPRQSDESN